jgi:hypothetical protein
MASTLLNPITSPFPNPIASVPSSACGNVERE